VSVQKQWHELVTFRVVVYLSVGNWLDDSLVIGISECQFMMLVTNIVVIEHPRPAHDCERLLRFL
jgi:hypothetical protein